VSRQHHELKTETKFYQASENWKKSFEVRKNDRNFQVHDLVILAEVVNGVPTGRKLYPREIIYVLGGGQYGIDPDYCVIGLRP